MTQIVTKLKTLFYSTLWVVGLGAGIAIPQQSVSAAVPETPELACKDALEKNTIEALEEYLRQYPDADTACRTLALDSLNQFGVPNPDDRGDSGIGGIDGGYGG